MTRTKTIGRWVSNMYQIIAGKARQNHNEFQKLIYALSESVAASSGIGSRTLSWCHSARSLIVSRTPWVMASQEIVALLTASISLPSSIASYGLSEMPPMWKPSLIPTNVDHLRQRAIDGKLAVAYLKYVRREVPNHFDFSSR